jgi:hypothetical protein
VAGFSIGGNVLLKYLGEQQLAKPPTLIGAIAVCPPIDLADCARNLSRARNAFYNFKFVTVLRLEARKHPELSADPRGLSLARPMSMQRFDDLVTAPAGGFESGGEYYAKCSAEGFLDEIAIPTLLLAADNDPFIPAAVYDDVPRSAFLTVEVTRGGGHLGFLSRQATPAGDHRWLDHALVEYARTLSSSPA